MREVDLGDAAVQRVGRLSSGDEALLLELAEEFDTEEIVELLYRAGQAVGSHRFVHVLDVLADTKPVLRYDAEAVRASWGRAYAVATGPAAH